VTKLLEGKEKELRDLAKNLFHYDYLTGEEMEQIIRGKSLKKEKVRDWDKKKEGEYLIRF
jgi:hypothetical protein